MKRHPRMDPIALALAACVLCPTAAAPGRRPRGPEIAAVTWSPHGAYKGWRVNLGPTGAQGWVDGSRIHVARVDKGSPADGVLEIGDVILGANEAAFPEGGDCRMALGRRHMPSLVLHAYPRHAPFHFEKRRSQKGDTHEVKLRARSCFEILVLMFPLTRIGP
jgi:hypothetical protein